MNDLFYPYLAVTIISFISVLLGSKLMNPSKPLFVPLCYLGFIIFFLGRAYELSRVVLDLELYNTFHLGFIGIIGAFSFWVSSNFALKHKINVKANQSVIIKSLIPSILVGILYFIILKGTVNKLERIIDFLIVVYACSNIYYCMRHLLLEKEDKTKLLKNLKFYNIFSILFSIIMVLLLVSYAYSIKSLLIGLSIILCINLLAMILLFSKGVKECK